MSRVFTDEGLLTWEVFSSSGPFGFPEQPKIVFQCLSEPNRRARFVVHDGDSADAAERVHGVPEDDLREMLRSSRELR